jgi:hypothetical protein
MCQPPDDVAYIMIVGENFYATPDDFVREALAQGVSKRVSHIPEKLQVGITPVYLAHNKAIVESVAPGNAELPEAIDAGKKTSKAEKAKAQSRMLDAERTVKHPAIFAMFTPRRIEKIVGKPLFMTEEQQVEFDKELARLVKQGITPVIVPADDPDHQPSKKRRKGAAEEE